MPPAVKRRLVTLAAGASLLLCIATVALWVRSYHTHDAICWAKSGGQYRCLDSAWGSIIYLRDEPCPYDLPITWASSGVPQGQTEVSTVLASDGREWIKPDYNEDGSLRSAGPWFFAGPARRRVQIPYAFVALCSVALPLGIAGSYVWCAQRARSLRRTGHCPTCGYDLRATPDRCPECGAAPGGDQSPSVTTSRRSVACGGLAPLGESITDVSSAGTIALPMPASSRRRAKPSD
jgi:hypothetical protein